MSTKSFVVAVFPKSFDVCWSTKIAVVRKHLAPKMSLAYWNCCIEILDGQKRKQHWSSVGMQIGINMASMSAITAMGSRWKRRNVSTRFKRRSGIDRRLLLSICFLKIDAACATRLTAGLVGVGDRVTGTLPYPLWWWIWKSNQFDTTFFKVWLQIFVTQLLQINIFDEWAHKAVKLRFDNWIVVI